MPQDYRDAEMIAWLATGIQRESARLSKHRKRLHNHELLTLNAPTTVDGEELLNCIATTSDTAAEAIGNTFVNEILSLLSRKQRIVVFETVIEDVPERVVADELGLSQQSIHRLKIRALRRLKMHFLMAHELTQFTHKPI